MLRPALMFSALLWACGETAQSSDVSVAHGGSSAGVPAGNGGAASDAGQASSMIGDGSLSGAGGDAIDVGPGAVGASAGGSAGSAGSRKGDSSSAGDPGQAGGTPIEPVNLCALAAVGGADPLEQSSLIGSNYRQILAQECRYAGLSCGVDVSAKIAFANTLRRYGPQLWHCDGLVATDFRLAYGDRKLTQADGEALVELYVALTMRKLLLTDSEALVLRKELLALMPPLLDPNAVSISLCGSGGVCPLIGGAGGTSSGSSGTGGTAGSNGGTGATSQAGAD